MSNRLIIIALGLAGLVAIVFILRQTQNSLPSISGDGIAQMIYMSIWGALIGSAVLTSRRPLGHTLKQLVIWLAIFLVVIAGYTLRYELQDLASKVTGGLVPGSPISTIDSNGRSQITLIRNRSGHFVAQGSIDSKSVSFLVDTGATDIVLANDDAANIGIDTGKLRYNIPVSTANGMTSSARTKIDAIAIGPIQYRNITVMVARKDVLESSLLGMNFINRLRSFEIRGDRMILTK
jgi:aspartyl protease family protein